MGRKATSSSEEWFRLERCPSSRRCEVPKPWVRSFSGTVNAVRDRYQDLPWELRDMDAYSVLIPSGERISMREFLDDYVGDPY